MTVLDAIIIWIATGVLAGAIVALHLDEKLMRWLRRSWFRHPLSLRPEFGRVAGGDLWLTGRVGLPHLYWNFDKGWHAKSSRFMGVAWSLGSYDYYVGLKDSN